MAEAAGSSQQHESSSSHVQTFSARHPMIPKLYVMPWKQDMKNQRLLMKNAALAEIPVVPLEESLCLRGRERLCHSQDVNRHFASSSSSSSSSSSAPLSHSGLPAHHSSHFSRYNSSVVTTRRLHRT
ncbi:sperm-associated microtubule inner protein 10 [Paralichthys olivaceus]|uniref:sperm-associated microtubule inner protein 10 n=1 Tax=Paralichthys olivaceus TaxID=8255 RepID=UPI00097D7BFC|nr:PREDICTED: testis-expressed sequence 43 protein [Paralichthys olivaceus]